jgi:predicted AAA+ superfamily ATPase
VLENQTAIEVYDHCERLQGWKRSSQGLEIDFVVSHLRQTWPLECKATMDVKRTHLRGLIGYLKDYDLPVGIIVSLSPWKVFDTDDQRRIVNIPHYLLERLPGLLESIRS